MSFLPLRWLRDMVGEVYFPRYCVKIDMRKAYDSAEWPFVEKMTLELGSGQNGVRDYGLYQLSVSYSVLVNGRLCPLSRPRRVWDKVIPFRRTFWQCQWNISLGAWVPWRMRCHLDFILNALEPVLHSYSLQMICWSSISVIMILLCMLRPSWVSFH